jgi:phosphatidylethanolamine/phosphatidyl-N-methylethanolamine N-methyltransferase
MSNDAAKAYWDRHASNYDRSMAILGGPIPAMVERARRAVEGASSVLEVAAGTGLVTLAIAGAAQRIVATDYAAGMVERLRFKLNAAGVSNVEVKQADVYALPFAAGTFDAVVAANVLHLVPDDRAALAALRRMLKPTGRLIVPTYCHQETLLARSVSRVLALTGFPGSRRFSMEQLRRTVETSDFKVVRAEVLPGVIPIGYVEAVLPHSVSAT